MDRVLAEFSDAADHRTVKCVTNTRAALPARNRSLGTYRLAAAWLVLFVLLTGCLATVQSAKDKVSHDVIAVQQCHDVNFTAARYGAGKTCDHSWSPNTTLTQCCQVATHHHLQASSNSTAEDANHTSPALPSPGSACCTGLICPDGTNFTVQRILSCSEKQSAGTHKTGRSVATDTNKTMNSTVDTYCCHRSCCQHKQHKIHKLEKKLRNVEKINHQWLVILSVTVALCGFVAIAFSLFMCHNHQLWTLPEFREILKKFAPGRKSRDSHMVRIGEPPLRVVTKELNESDYLAGARRSKASPPGGTHEDGEDNTWLLNSVFNGSQNDTVGHSYNDVSVVVPHPVQPHNH